MKTWFTCLGYLILSLSSWAEVNLLNNGNFSQDKSGWQTRGQIVTLTQGGINRVLEIKLNPKEKQVISTKIRIGEKTQAVVFSLKIKLLPGFMAQTREIEALQFGVKEEDGSGSFSGNNLKSVEEWQEFSYEFDQLNGRNLELQIIISPGVGSVYLDDIGIVEKNEPTDKLPMLFRQSQQGDGSGPFAWEKRDLEFSPKLEEKVIKGQFIFTNLQKSSVSILDVQPSNSDVITELDKKRFEPNESGALKFELDVALDSGTNDYFILVETDDTKQPAARLSLKVCRPEFIKIEPREVSWLPEEGNMIKVIKVEAGSQTPIQVWKAKAYDTNIVAEVKVIEAGRKYQVEVKPVSLAMPLRTYLDITASYGADNQQRGFNSS